MVKINLLDLLEEGEVLVEYHLTNEYVTRNAISTAGTTDLYGALENTLHIILDNGGCEDDVYYIMGAKIPTEDEMKELEEFEEYTSLDLGYVLPGLIDSWKEL